MLPNLRKLIPGYNVQLDSCGVSSTFGKLNLPLREKSLHHSLSSIMSPVGSAGGLQTGGSILCSPTMKNSFGGKNTYVAHNIAEKEEVRRGRDGLMKIITKDGMEMCRHFDGAYEQMLRDRILFVNEESNLEGENCRKILPMLAGQPADDGGTTVIYGAMGAKGDEIQVVGDLPEEQRGSGTCPMLAIMQTFKDAPKELYIFITGGRLDDIAQVREYIIALSKTIHEKKVNSVKFVLIGIGLDIDKAGFAEVQEAGHRRIKRFTNGLIAKIEFMLPAGALGFKMIQPNVKAIKQQLRL